jgi:hypothetical protein
MKKYQVAVLVLALSFLLASCAYYPPGRYNTQVGAAVGAGTGALLGQAIGGNTESTLIGLAAGTMIGALVGNAVDQQDQAARDAAAYGKPVIYYDESGRAVEAIPEGSSDPNCQKVRKRVWENGKLVKETVEETCSTPPVARYYYPAPPPPPPPAYYYGWWAWPRFSFYFGRPYYRGYYRYGPYGRYGGWH